MLRKQSLLRHRYRRDMMSKELPIVTTGWLGVSERQGRRGLGEYLPQIHARRFGARQGRLSDRRRLAVPSLSSNPNDLSHFQNEKDKIAQPGCPACQKVFYTTSQFIDHLTNDVVAALVGPAFI
jgi:hypothetical protein